MANVINTRIQLKYDTLAEWTAKNPLLLAGELAIVTIGNSHTDTTPDNGTHPVLFKVGPGNFNSLPFASALAADVYAWAKCQTVELDGEVIKFHNGDKTKPVHTIDLSKFALDADLGDVTTLTTTAETAVGAINELDEDLGDVSTLTTTKKTAVGAINEHDSEIGDLTALNTTNKTSLVNAINEALQAVEVGGTGSVVTLVKEDKTTYDEYTLKQGGEAVGDKIIVGKNSLTMKAGNGLSATETTFSANSDTAPTFEVSHANTSDVADVADAHFQLIAGMSFDEFGHVTEVKKHTLDFTAQSKSGGGAMLDLICDSSASTQPKIVNIDGAGATTVTVATEGNITISSTDTNTAHTHSAGTGLIKTGDGGIDGNVEYAIDETYLTNKIGTQLTSAMEFKGATASLPTNSDLQHGDMYKVSAEFPVAQALDAENKGFTAKVGDSIVYDGVNKKWYLIPSGDDIEDTWRIVKVTNGDTTTTLENNEALELIAGEGIALTEEGGKVTITNDIEHNLMAIGQSGYASIGLSLNNTRPDEVALKGDDYIVTSSTDDDHNNILHIEATKKLSDAVALAETALQPIVPVADQALSGATVVKGVAQAADGKITVSTRTLTPADIGAQPKGDYKIQQTAVVDPTSEGEAVDFIATIAQDINGNITATKKHVNFSDYVSLVYADGNYKKKQDAKNGTLTGAEVLGSWSQDTNGVMTVTPRTLTPKDIGASPDTHNHSIYELEEGSNTTVTGGVEYLIFNCGSASTLVD